MRTRVIAAILISLAAFAAPTPLRASLMAPAHAATSLNFSGYSWNIKSSAGRVGPGPNYFNAANVWVDTQGYLHLRIAKSGGRWYTGEVVNQQNLGYGTYTWTLGSRVDTLNRNAVLGLFTWDDAADYNHREIDFEAARWGVATDSTNAQFVVQPYNQAGNLKRIALGSTVPSTISFTWKPSGVDFSALSNALTAFAYTGGYTPIPGAENARMNLWLYQGKAPSDGKAVEVIIRSFTFTPLVS